MIKDTGVKEQFDILIKLQKELFEKYTGINVNHIMVLIKDNIESEQHKDVSGKTFIDENGKISVILNLNKMLSADYTNLLIAWHEFIHYIDLEKVLFKNDIKFDYEKWNIEFTVWSEFRAYFFSYKLYLNFLFDNKKIKEKDVVCKIEKIKCEYKKLTDSKYSDTVNTTVYSIIYDFISFYGMYLALIEFLPESKYELKPKEFMYDYRFIFLEEFLLDNKRMTLDSDKWNRLKKIINTFIKS